MRRLIEKFRDFRNRKVADPAFRRFAARFPLTRPMARRETRALFDLTAGFVYSQVLSACIRLNLFENLADGPATAQDIAARTGLTGEAAERLLKAAAALDLTETRSGGRFALGRLGAALVGNPGVSAMIAHHRVLYEDLADPVALLKGEAAPNLNRYWSYASHGDHEGGAAYSALMGASQSFIADEVLDAWPPGGYRTMLDLGGGDGTFLLSAAKRAPDLRLILYDLPEVAAIARQRLAATEIAGRIDCVGGSFFDGGLPAGADLVTLNRVLHDHDDEPAQLILAAARKAIAPGGTVLVAEPMAETPGAEAAGDAYFGFYLLAMGQGRPRTAPEIKDMLRAAGFVRPREIATATPLIVRLIVATAPTPVQNF